MSNFGNMPNLNLGMIAPLDKPRFESAYRNFCSKRALKPDARALTIESRQVDLHRLHVEVMKEGGAQKVLVTRHCMLWYSHNHRLSKGISGTLSAEGLDSSNFPAPTQILPRPDQVSPNNSQTSTKSTLRSSSNGTRLRRSKTADEQAYRRGNSTQQPAFGQLLSKCNSLSACPSCRWQSSRLVALTKR